MTEAFDLPAWVIFHVPHASTFVPKAVRNQFVLNDEDMAKELVLMTDHATDWLFVDGLRSEQVVKSPVSRLVVDVERFSNDEQEPMSRRGMGAIYTRRANTGALRRELIATERHSLMDDWYWPHHQRLEDVAEGALQEFSQALVLDCHSFPSEALPYEPNQNAVRPEICIGTDEFHTREKVAQSFVESFKNEGFWVELNSPFAGALVPAACYQKDRRVQGVMIEVRRDVYLDERSGELSASAYKVRERVRAALSQAVEMTKEVAGDR